MKANNAIITAIIIVLVGIVFFFALRAKPQPSVLVENFTLLDTIYLSEQEPTLGNMTIEFNIDFPVQFSDQNVLSKLKSMIFKELFGENFADYAEDSLLTDYAAALGKEYIDNNADFAKRITDGSRLSFNNAIILDGFALHHDQHVFSYGISRFVDFGGAHPNRTRLFYNFDLRDGSIITEDEIFKEGYQTELSEIIKTKLLGDLNANEDTPFMENFDNSDYYPEEIKPNGNFYIHKEAINYIFNPYEIAPYYIGETEVVLPYDLITHLMKEGNLLEYLALTINN